MRAILSGLLLGSALLICAACRGGDGDNDIHRVAREDLPILVEATGTLRAVQSASISPPAAPHVWRYKITRLVPESTEVRKGQPIVSFDTSELERELDRKRAERDQAAKEIEKRELELAVERVDLELQLAEARGRLRRAGLKVDVPEDLTGRLELEQARLDRDLALAEVDSLERRLEFSTHSGEVQLELLRGRRDRAELRVQELEKAIRAMTVRAPRDGLVIQGSGRRRGEKLKQGDTVSRWEKILEIPDLDLMEAEAEIDEVDGGRVTEGQTVTLRLEAHPDREYTGLVSSIAPTVRRQSWRDPLKVYEVIFSLDETDRERMRPGMRFRAEIEVDRLSRVLVVPLEAVRPRPGGPVVFVRRRGDLVETPVELGARNATHVEVKGGLEEGVVIARRAPTRSGRERS